MKSNQGHFASMFDLGDFYKDLFGLDDDSSSQNTSVLMEELVANEKVRHKNEAKTSDKESQIRDEFLNYLDELEMPNVSCFGDRSSKKIQPRSSKKHSHSKRDGMRNSQSSRAQFLPSQIMPEMNFKEDSNCSEVKHSTTEERAESKLKRQVDNTNLLLKTADNATNKIQPHMNSTYNGLKNGQMPNSLFSVKPENLAKASALLQSDDENQDRKKTTSHQGQPNRQMPNSLFSVKPENLAKAKLLMSDGSDKEPQAKAMGQKTKKSDPKSNQLQMPNLLFNVKPENLAKAKLLMAENSNDDDDPKAKHEKQKQAIPDKKKAAMPNSLFNVKPENLAKAQLLMEENSPSEKTANPSKKIEPASLENQAQKVQPKAASLFDVKPENLKKAMALFDSDSEGKKSDMNGDQLKKNQYHIKRFDTAKETGIRTENPPKNSLNDNPVHKKNPLNSNNPKPASLFDVKPENLERAKRMLQSDNDDNDIDNKPKQSSKPVNPIPALQSPAKEQPRRILEVLSTFKFDECQDFLFEGLEKNEHPNEKDEVPNKTLQIQGNLSLQNELTEDDLLLINEFITNSITNVNESHQSVNRQKDMDIDLDFLFNEPLSLKNMPVVNSAPRVVKRQSKETERNFIPPARVSRPIVNVNKRVNVSNKHQANAESLLKECPKVSRYIELKKVTNHSQVSLSIGNSPEITRLINPIFAFSSDIKKHIQSFFELYGVSPKQLSDDWLKHHFQLLSIKMALYKIQLPESTKTQRTKELINQLLYRYWREEILEHNSVIRQIINGELFISSCFSLLVSSIIIENKQMLVQLTDGWYCLYLAFDLTTPYEAQSSEGLIFDLILRGKICPGKKVKLVNARWKALSEKEQQTQERTLYTRNVIEIDYNCIQPGDPKAKLGLLAVWDRPSKFDSIKGTGQVAMLDGFIIEKSPVFLRIGQTKESNRMVQIRDEYQINQFLEKGQIQREKLGIAFNFKVKIIDSFEWIKRCNGNSNANAESVIAEMIFWNVSYEFYHEIILYSRYKFFLTQLFRVYGPKSSIGRSSEQIKSLKLSFNRKQSKLVPIIESKEQIMQLREYDTSQFMNCKSICDSFKRAFKGPGTEKINKLTSLPAKIVEVFEGGFIAYFIRNIFIIIEAKFNYFYDQNIVKIGKIVMLHKLFTGSSVFLNNEHGKFIVLRCSFCDFAAVYSDDQNDRRTMPDGLKSLLKDYELQKALKFYENDEEVIGLIKTQFCQQLTN